MTVEHKVLALEDVVIDSAEGTGRGYGAVFNNVDDGNDLIEPGFFDPVLDDFLREGFISWGHDWDTPVAYPTHAQPDAHGLDLGWNYHSTPAAQEARTIAAERRAAGKSMGLSIGYEVDQSSTRADGVRLLQRAKRLFEVGLVMVPMNRLAVMTEAKARKAAIATHETGTSDEAWDAAEAEANLSNDAGAATYRQAHAWVDPDGDPDTKAAYRFIHHQVGADGTVGAANLVACSTGIGVLNGGRGGTTIPAGDHQGVWNHLAKHLRDADREPPELRGATLVAGRPFADRLDLVLVEAEALVQHAKVRQELRAKEGRVLSASNRERLSTLSDQLRAVLVDISELLSATEPAPKALNASVGRLRLYQALLEHNLTTEDIH